MLLLAVVLQLVPFLYMYAALVRLAARSDARDGYYKKRTLWMAGISGLVTTAVGMCVAFLPQTNDEPVWLFELKMVSGCAFFLGLGAFFYFIYSRRASGGSRAPGAASPARGEPL
jgi:amino acid transporter